jgi:ribonuclease Z
MTDSDFQFAASVRVGPYTVRGASVGGIYTTIQVPELSVLLDVGLPLRAFCAADDIFLSHGHVDHVGGLFGLLGVRGMMHKERPPRVFMPAEIEPHLQEALRVMERLQRFPLAIRAVPMDAGDEEHLGNNLYVRAFRTHHPVPSLGYQFLRKVSKLRPEFAKLAGPEIAARKRAGEDLFELVEHLELAYATDTLLRVIDTTPSILTSRVLILECTFLDERKRLAQSRAGCHIHLDELLEVCDRFENEHLVLMHTSQIYSPRQAREILERRMPKSLHERVQLLAPPNGRAFL